MLNLLQSWFSCAFVLKIAEFRKLFETWAARGADVGGVAIDCDAVDGDTIDCGAIDGGAIDCDAIDSDIIDCLASQ